MEEELLKLIEIMAVEAAVKTIKPRVEGALKLVEKHPEEWSEISNMLCVTASRGPLDHDNPQMPSLLIEWFEQLDLVVRVAFYMGYEINKSVEFVVKDTSTKENDSGPV